MKCNETNKLLEKFHMKKRKQIKCQSISDIDKWLADKEVRIQIKENFVNYDDFEQTIQHQFINLGNEKLSKDSVVKKLKLVKS